MSSSYKYTLPEMLGEKGKNIYILEARFTRERNVDNTQSIRKRIEEKFKRFGRYHSSDRHFFGQTIIHIANFEEFWHPIAFNPEYEGVFFLSNVSNGSEIYFKLRNYDGFSGPFPWFRGNITLPIDKLMEVGDEMVSYPKKNQMIKNFLELFEKCSSLGSLNGARYDSSPEFDQRYRADYRQKPYYPSHDTWDGFLDNEVVQCQPPNPFTG